MASKTLRKSKPVRSAAATDLRPAGDLDPAADLMPGGDLPPAGDLGRRGPAPALAAGGASGDDILALARPHINEPYVLGARAPMANSQWRGPWDCAEFVSWCVFQASGVLYGTEPRDDPMRADAFTGFWAQQARAGGHLISVEQAARIPGAAVLRKPAPGAIGHIVISDGQGGTVEAHSSKRGVIAASLQARRWDAGVLVPGIRYLQSDVAVVLPPAPQTIRLTEPLTRGETVRAVQQRLLQLKFPVGSTDGIYGPQTAHAVKLFQAGQGLVADGEIGPATLTALGLG